jgi:hypothetical protein
LRCRCRRRRPRCESANSRRRECFARGLPAYRGVEQRLNGPAAHGVIAVELVHAATERHHRRQKTRGGTGVTDEDGRARRGDEATAAGHGERARTFIGMDGEAERRETTCHVQRIVAEERTGERRASAGQAGQQERAVGMSSIRWTDRAFDGAPRRADQIRCCWMGNAGHGHLYIVRNRQHRKRRGISRQGAIGPEWTGVERDIGSRCALGRKGIQGTAYRAVRMSTRARLARVVVKPRRLLAPTALPARDSEALQRFRERSCQSEKRTFSTVPPRNLLVEILFLWLMSVLRYSG